MRGDDPKVYVFINRERMLVENRPYRLTELLAMAKPIPDGHELWRVVPGAPDEKVGDDEVDVFLGMRIYSAPRYINN